MTTAQSKARNTRAPAARAPAKEEAKSYTFVWEGRDRTNKPVRGTTRARGEATVRSNLRRQGVVVTKLKKQRFQSQGKITPKDIASFTRQLSTLVKTGVPLLMAFDIIAKGSTNAALSNLLTNIKTEIEVGSSLSVAFTKYPNYFDALYCNLISAGEQAGILDSLLERLALHQEKSLALKSKVKSAMTYPLTVIGVAMAIVAVIMLFVIPKFKMVFESFNAELPMATQLLITASNAFTDYWYVIFATMAGIYFGASKALKNSKKLQEQVDISALKAPIAGKIIRSAVVARWTRTLSTMIAAGVPIIDALDSVAGIAGNVVYRKATQQIRNDVTGGQGLALAVNNTQVFPHMVQQMVAIGEESGTLDDMLGKVAEMYEAEVDTAVDNLSALMEPLIMVVLGTLIGGIVAAMYLPIFKMGGAV